MKTWRKRLAAGLLTLVLGVSLVPGAFAASAYDCPGQKLAALTSVSYTHLTLPTT